MTPTDRRYTTRAYTPAALPSLIITVSIGHTTPDYVEVIVTTHDVSRPFDGSQGDTIHAVSAWTTAVHDPVDGWSSRAIPGLTFPTLDALSDAAALNLLRVDR